MQSDRFRAACFYLAIALIPLLTFIGMSFYGYITYRNNGVQATLNEEERLHVNNAFYRLTTGFDSVISDLLILSKSDSLREYVNREAKLFEVARTFTLIARERKIYDRIRFIDSRGKEVVAINYEGNRPYLEWPDNLKNVADTSDFRRVSRLQPGTVYFSEVKAEGQQAVYSPASNSFITVATPLIDSNGHFHGIVALSLKSTAFLDPVRAQWQMAPGVAMVVSSDGRFISVPDKKVNGLAGIDYEKSFALAFPKAWDELRYNQSGQIRNDAGLFTYKTLSAEVLEEYHGSAINVVMAHSNNESGVSPYSLSIIGYIPSQAIHSYVAISFFNWGMLAASLAFAVLLSVIFMQMKVRQRESDKHIRLVAHVEEVTRDGVVIYDKDGHIVSVNPAFTILTGFLPHEVLGKTAAFFRSESADDSHREVLLAEALQTDSAIREVNCASKRGGTFPIATTVSVMRNPNGSVENYIEIFSDITYLKRKESKLVRQAYYDALTGVPNRLLFEERLKMVMKSCRRRGEKFALLFIDVNDFKEVNDRFGHDFGDKVLSHLAGCLNASVRESDTVARLGGDEFVVIANNIHGREDARRLVDKLTDLVAKPLVMENGETLSVSVSVGISIYPDDSDSESGLTKVADLAMYRQKAQKKSAEVLSDISKRLT